MYKEKYRLQKYNSINEHDNSLETIIINKKELKKSKKDTLKLVKKNLGWSEKQVLDAYDELIACGLIKVI